MKLELYRWLRAQRLSPKDKFILQKLCDYANDNTFEAGVRIADLVEDTCWCERSIQNGLRRLEADERIVNTGRTKRLRSGGTPRVYRIAPELAIGGASHAPTPLRHLHPEGRSCVHPSKEAGISLSKERRESQGVKSPVPPAIRKLFVDYLGEGFGTAFLDRCEWDNAKRTFNPHSARAYERIRFEGWRVLQDLKITVVKPSV
jgi:hypothetical protein